MIDVKDLALFLDKKRLISIIQNLSFQVEKNRCFGLVGPSGSGKSTLLRSFCSLHSHWTGEILIDQKPLLFTKKTPMVQMVFQDPLASLHPRQTVYEILKEPLIIQHTPYDEQTFVKALQDVSLPIECLFRYPHQLSGGQRQRVSIARSLLTNPKVLLLDECTSALDVTVQKEVLLLIKSLMEERGMTCIMVSHDLDVIQFMCYDWVDLKNYSSK